MDEDQARTTALSQAVIARHLDEDAATTVQRAEAFYRFLIPPEQKDYPDG